MTDYLNELCIQKNIRLIYTNNKYSILTCKFTGNVPVIRAQKLFKYCPAEIAEAIVNYFTDNENSNNYYKIIEDFINKKFDLKEYRIIPPKINFSKYLKGNNEDKNDDKFIETDISSMILKDFWGENMEASPDGTISVSDDNIAEVDIVIEPRKTP